MYYWKFLTKLMSFKKSAYRLTKYTIKLTPFMEVVLSLISNCFDLIKIDRFTGYFAKFRGMVVSLNQ